MAHHTQYVFTILLVERIACVNKEKLPVILLVVLFPQETHHMNSFLYPGFQPPVEFLHPAGLLSL